MSEEEGCEKGIAVMQKWAQYGRRLRPMPRIVSWEPVKPMIGACKKLLDLKWQALMRMLDESDKRLAPLKDPQRVDLGMHRWLSEEREESYSDWLQWVIEALGSAESIFRVLGIEAPEVASRRQFLKPQVDREVWVEKGHDEQSGRLDLLIQFARETIIVVEVKLTDAESADTDKQKGYWDSLENKYKESAEKKQLYAKLLVVNAEKLDYWNFKPITWKDLCLELRRIVAEGKWRTDRLMEGAMILAFVGAVEQNLLGFSASSRVNFNSGLLNHIERFLEEGSNERSDGK